MIVSKKAVPTEYKGVRFRSKSEACFARYLHSMNYDWEYEPEAFALGCGYVPDFLSVRTIRHKFFTFLIEYKPSEPTETYIESCMDKLERCAGRMQMEWVVGIYYGSFWENNSAGMIFRTRSENRRFNGWSMSTGDDKWELRQSISQYRYDLKQ